MDDLSRGVERFNEGRFEEALACFRAAPGGRAFLGPAYAGLARFLLARAPARDARAERALLRVLALKPGAPGRRDALLESGRAFRALGDLASAERAFARAGAREEFAALLVARGGERDLRRILAADPCHARARADLAALLRRRGLALMSAGRAGADRAFRAALALSPRDAEARRSLDKLARARSLAAKARRERARQAALARRLAARETRRLASEREAAARRERAALLRERALAYDVPNAPERREEALAAWRAAASADPADGSARIAESLLLRWVGRPAEERAALRRALAKGSVLDRAARFRALMRLRRCAEAARLAERTLDAGPSLADLRAFWDPWEKDDRPERGGPEADWRAVGRSLRGVRGPWRAFYLGMLDGPRGLGHFDGLPRGGRYGWMQYGAAMKALFSGGFRRAIDSFGVALRRAPADWRGHGYLAEAHACVDEPALALRQMARAAAAAPPPERAQALAWQSELDLWLGDYETALARASRAAELGAPFAHGWKGAALLKLGRPAEAAAQLDRALAMYPHDDEARLWRAEARRELGRFEEALDDLAGVTRQHGVWILINRALARRALGDEAGMRADFAALPEAVARRLLAADARLPEALEAGLRLGRGFRRGEYGQAVWLSRAERA